MAKASQVASDPVTDGPETPAPPTPTAETPAKEAPKPVESPTADSVPTQAPVFATRYFKVSIPSNPPLVVKVEALSTALNWGELAIKEFNRIRGIISTVHVYEVHEAETSNG